MKTTFRTKVMKQAHEMRTSTGKTFSICLIKAWQAYRLGKRMTTEAVRFCYEKIDGTLRYAVGTLKSLSNDLIKGTGTPNYKTIAYFDTEQNAFRSFKIENLVQVY